MVKRQHQNCRSFATKLAVHCCFVKAACHVEGEYGFQPPRPVFVCAKLASGGWQSVRPRFAQGAWALTKGSDVTVQGLEGMLKSMPMHLFVEVRAVVYPGRSRNERPLLSTLASVATTGAEGIVDLKFSVSMGPRTWWAEGYHPRATSQGSLAVPWLAAWSDVVKGSWLCCTTKALSLVLQQRAKAMHTTPRSPNRMHVSDSSTWCQSTEVCMIGRMGTMEIDSM